MQHNQDAIKEAMRLAKTAEGQQLIRLLQSADSVSVQEAMAKASAGDYQAAKQALSALLNNPEAQKLLHQLGGSHGSNGR